MTQRVLVEYYDVWHRYGTALWHQVDGTTGDAMVAALQAHSNMGVWLWSQGDEHVVNQVPSADPYNDRDIYALLTFCTAAGVPVKVRLPCPAIGIFKVPDGTAVDPTQIGDILSAALGVVCDIAGNPVTSYSGGVRAMSGRADY